MKTCNVGDKVIVRSFGNKASIGRVLDCNAEAVFICKESIYDGIMNGTMMAPEIGIPISDVYIYDSGAESGVIDWSKLRPVGFY